MEKRFKSHAAVNAITTRAKGWQANCWNWARAYEPFEVYGVQPKDLPFCQALSAAYRCKFRSRLFRGEYVISFEPGVSETN